MFALQYGATLACKDNESLTPLDLCTKDHVYMPFVQTNKEIGEWETSLGLREVLS